MWDAYATGPTHTRAHDSTHGSTHTRAYGSTHGGAYSSTHSAAYGELRGERVQGTAPATSMTTAPADWWPPSAVGPSGVASATPRVSVGRTVR